MKLLDKATSNFNKQLPFVLYAKPNEQILHGFFQENDALHVFENQSGFVFSSFYNQTNVVFPVSESEIFQEEIDVKIENTSALIENELDENAQYSFESIVRKAVSEIEKGTLEKVVLSRKIEISQSVDFIQSYQKLLISYPTAFRYIWFHPKVGMWMGATPEQLAKINNKTIETVALAGTQVFSENVFWQEKEQVEQQLVIDYIKNRIGNFVDNLAVSNAYTHRAGNIVHLKSDISGKLKPSISEIEVIQAIHPTSAVCGMPLQEARNFILEHENYDRNYYAGFLGEFQIQEQTNLFVNLRCCEIFNDNIKNLNKVNIYVGCGITKDSNANKEFIETENKAKTIKNILVKV